MGGDRYVALIRGINVGRAKRVAMADLRASVAELGFRDARTLLNSGNVVFGATAAGARDAAVRIEDALTKKLGVTARVIVLSAAEVMTIVNENDLRDVAAEPARLLVSVPRNASDRTRLELVAQQDWTPEMLSVGSRAAYLWCPDGILASRLAEAVARRFGAGATSRNWATILKLHALVTA